VGGIFMASGFRIAAADEKREVAAHNLMAALQAQEKTAKTAAEFFVLAKRYRFEHQNSAEALRGCKKALKECSLLRSNDRAIKSSIEGLLKILELEVAADLLSKEGATDDEMQGALATITQLAKEGDFPARQFFPSTKNCAQGKIFYVYPRKRDGNS
jgi:hypothetical protein